MSNEELYRKTNGQPLTLLITKARWNLFGHILRRPEDIPANVTMRAYFEPSDKPGYRSRSPIIFPKLLDEDLEKYGKNTPYPSVQLDHSYHRSLKLKNTNDLIRLRDIAQDRDDWNVLTQQIVERRQAETRQPTN